MKKVLEYAHYLLEEVLSTDDVAIDMTCGNGYDTEYLVKLAKHVYSFDIQKQALENTKKRLNATNVTYINANHQFFKNYVKEEVKAIIFNLGYLPGGDKSITTTKHTTIPAIKDSINQLSSGGICVIVIYPGHPNGSEEARAIEELLVMLNQKFYDCLKYQFINQIHNPPYLIAIKRH